MLEKLFGIDGPDWFNHYWLALGANIVAYTWKTMPFWTLIFLAGRMAIPQDLYDAADIDGATGLRRFVHVVIPLLANLYLICTLLATIWMIGDFNTPDMVSGGAPHGSTAVLATLGVDYTCSTPAARARRGRRDGGAAGADPGRNPADPPAADEGGAAMSVALRSRPAGRRRTGCAGGSTRRARRCSSVVLLIWWLLPLYNMLLIALDPEGDTEFTGDIWPSDPTLEAFAAVSVRRVLVPQGFLAPVRQQLLHRRHDDGADRADQFARQLRAGPHAARQGLA